jgi:hypothetical protein
MKGKERKGEEIEKNGIGWDEMKWNGVKRNEVR